MKRIRSGYQRVDRFQKRLWVKVALSVLLAGICAAIFVPILISSYEFRGRLMPMMEEMYTTSLEDHTPAMFLQTGEYVFEGETYGGPELIEFAQSQFSPDGNFVDPGTLAALLLARSIPDWMPGWLLLHTGTTWLLLGCLILWFMLVIWLELSLPLFVVV